MKIRNHPTENMRNQIVAFQLREFTSYQSNGGKCIFFGLHCTWSNLWYYWTNKCKMRLVKRDHSVGFEYYFTHQESQVLLCLHGGLVDRANLGYLACQLKIKYKKWFTTLWSPLLKIWSKVKPLSKSSILCKYNTELRVKDVKGKCTAATWEVKDQADVIERSRFTKVRFL